MDLARTEGLVAGRMVQVWARAQHRPGRTLGVRWETTMIVCPRCSYENKDSAMNCARCRINLQWALENLPEAVPHNLERVEGPPPEAQAENRVVRAIMLIVLLLAIPASGCLAFYNLLSYGFTPNSKEQWRSEYMTAGWFWLVASGR